MPEPRSRRTPYALLLRRARGGDAAAPAPLEPCRPGHLGLLERPSARRIVATIHASLGGATVRELTDALGVHHTTVRSQLAALASAGIVEAYSDPPAGPGRPPVRWALKPRPSGREAANHRALVRLLMSLARGMGLGPDEVERFGAGQGAATVRPGGGVPEIVAAFERLGFAPRCAAGGAPGEVVLGRCPFAGGADAAAEQLICRMHRGLVPGMAQVAAPGVELLDFGVKDAAGAGCRLRLSRAA